jgi:predicted ATPase
MVRNEHYGRVIKELFEAAFGEILGATRDRMLREISEVLETIALESALLLVLEDLHWMDHATV